MPPKLSIVVCTYNRAGLLPRCLRALAAQTLDPATFEIVVVDNNSRDETAQVIAKFAAETANLRGTFEGMQGHAHARNRGWKEARGEFVAYIDDDCRAAPDWAEKILQALATGPTPPAAVGGEIRPDYEEPPPQWFDDSFETRSWGARGFLQGERAENGFAGANMAFPRKTLEDLNGFSTDYGIVAGKLRMGEDTELFQRIYARDPHLWFEPAAVVYHWVPAETTRIRYRLWRSFKGGEAYAFMEGRQFYSWRTLASAASLAFYSATTLPAAMLRPENRSLGGMVRQLQSWTWRAGFVWGGKR